MESFLKKMLVTVKVQIRIGSLPQILSFKLWPSTFESAQAVTLRLPTFAFVTTPPQVNWWGAWSDAEFTGP